MKGSLEKMLKLGEGEMASVLKAVSEFKGLMDQAAGLSGDTFQTTNMCCSNMKHDFDTAFEMLTKNSAFIKKFDLTKTLGQNAAALQADPGFQPFIQGAKEGQA